MLHKILSLCCVFLSELQHADSSTSSGLVNESKAFVHTTHARQLSSTFSSVNLPAIVATKSRKLRAWNKQPLTGKRARNGATWDGSWTSIYMTTPGNKHRVQQRESASTIIVVTAARRKLHNDGHHNSYVPFSTHNLRVETRVQDSLMSNLNKKCVNTFYKTCHIKSGKETN